MVYVYFVRNNDPDEIVGRIEIAGNEEKPAGLWDAMEAQFPESYDALMNSDIADIYSISDRGDEMDGIERLNSDWEFALWLMECA